MESSSTSSSTTLFAPPSPPSARPPDSEATSAGAACLSASRNRGKASASVGAAVARESAASRAERVDEHEGAALIDWGADQREKVERDGRESVSSRREVKLFFSPQLFLFFSFLSLPLLVTLSRPFKSKSSKSLLLPQGPLSHVATNKHLVPLTMGAGWRRFSERVSRGFFSFFRVRYPIRQLLEREGDRAI